MEKNIAQERNFKISFNANRHAYFVIFHTVSIDQSVYPDLLISDPTMILITSVLISNL